MKKKIIITATFAACLALCAAVWPQAETVKETPVPASTPAVTAPEAMVVELKTKFKAAPLAEKEKSEIPQPEQIQEAVPEPESALAEISVVPEVQPKPESEPVTEATHEPVPEQNIVPSATQEITEPLAGNMVYVEGFGWIESQGPNNVEYAEDMYENGNKIGIMG